MSSHVSGPFAHVLVPYDASDPARAALELALSLARGGARLTVVTVVNEMPVIEQSVSDMVLPEPEPLMAALDEEGARELADAAALCRTAGIVPELRTVHDLPVAGIIAAAETEGCDLVIMGTHARSGVARTFLGSTAEGVLRSSRIPVITVRTAAGLSAAPFSDAVVAIDESDPADAAARIAARLAQTAKTNVTACHAIDLMRLYDNAATYGFDPEQIAEELRTEGRTLVTNALARAQLPNGTAVEIVDGDAAGAVITVARKHHATLIIVGTHGRRGLRRLFLGSVAESIVRTSDVPVLVVPVTRHA